MQLTPLKNGVPFGQGTSPLFKFNLVEELVITLG
jgi:hypothetical protein